MNSEYRFRHRPDRPAHLSVGVVLLDKQNRVALLKHPAGHFPQAFYSLARETLQDDEPLEAAAHRGLREELGATAIMVDYLDSLRTAVPTEDDLFYKTTLYFLMRLQAINFNKRAKNDPEGDAEVIWVNLDTAYELFDKQAVQLPNDQDLHEARLITWSRQYISARPI